MFNWFSKSKQQDEPNEADLIKQGFDPLKDVPVSDQEFNIQYEFVNEDYLDLSQKEIVQMFVAFRPYPNKDDPRHQYAHPKGGIICSDQSIISLERQVARDILKEIGKKILNGDFNLTKIPFPIKICIPKTALQTTAEGTMLFPLYLNLATMDPYPRNRFIYTIVAVVGAYYWQASFLKPLNPILGETLEGYYNDGSKIYVEQISHHPPVSYFFMEGMNRAYKYSGYYHVDASAGLNSLKIVNKGTRKLVFKDGQTIEISSPNEEFFGTFVGTTRQVTTGKMRFHDRKHDLHCELVFGNNSKKYFEYFQPRPIDHFEGRIFEKGKPNGQVEGSYLSYINVDDVRYWDIRYTKPYKLNFRTSLQSDHQIRADLISLRNGEVQIAQKQKDQLEDNQRNDRLCRDKARKAKR